MNCDICNVKATSQKNFDSHLNGKLHLKTFLKHKQNLNESSSKIDNQTTSTSIVLPCHTSCISSF